MISGYFGVDLWLVVFGLIYAGLGRCMGGDSEFWLGGGGPTSVPLSGTTKDLERSALRFLCFLL